MKIKDGFVLREICGEKVLSEEGSLNVNMSKFIKLNDTAAFLIENLWAALSLRRSALRTCFAANMKWSAKRH